MVQLSFQTSDNGETSTTVNIFAILWQYVTVNQNKKLRPLLIFRLDYDDNCLLCICYNVGD